MENIKQPLYGFTSKSMQLLNGSVTYEKLDTDGKVVGEVVIYAVSTNKNAYPKITDLVCIGLVGKCLVAKSREFGGM